MPQQHPGRLQILVVDAHCKRRLFQRKHRQTGKQALPDVSARRITVSWCTTDNRFCSDWSVLQQPLPLAQGQQLPPSASTGLAVVNTTKTKDLVKTGGGRVLFS
uniref:Uncharacterized protein n=1 Tax=Escherichia coli TaxID=562 RepID=A0A8F1IFC6_ECOLX|nr:hypothetical protein IHCLGBEB_00187 [Escherichia coli]